MFVEFDQMPSHARVWIYTADRKMTAGEAEQVAGKLTAFAGDWAAHGTPLKASCKIDRERFILLAVDDQFHGPSGCSIDTSVNALKELGAETGIDFFNRSLVPFIIDNEVVLFKVAELKGKYADGVWNGRTLTFNTLAGTVGEVRDNWTLPAAETWLKRYMEPLREDSLAG